MDPRHLRRQRHAQRRLLTHAAGALVDGRPSDCVSLASLAADVAPHCAGAYALRGQAWLELGDPESALQDFHAARALLTTGHWLPRFLRDDLAGVCEAAIDALNELHANGTDRRAELLDWIHTLAQESRSALRILLTEPGLADVRPAIQVLLEEAA